MARQTLTASIVYRDRPAAIDWLKRAFGFETTMLLETKEGEIAHCEMRLGDSMIMVASEWSDDHRSPTSVGGKNTQALHIHIEEDIEAHCARAEAAGADIFARPETQFYGDRSYRCRDPEGHIWTVAQTVASVSREEAEQASGLKITGWV